LLTISNLYLSKSAIQKNKYCNSEIVTTDRQRTRRIRTLRHMITLIFSDHKFKSIEKAALIIET